MGSFLLPIPSLLLIPATGFSYITVLQLMPCDHRLSDCSDSWNYHGYTSLPLSFL
ncbi:hypothetical protein V8E54_014995 [Elaphomyces granulatus]